MRSGWYKLGADGMTPMRCDPLDAESALTDPRRVIAVTEKKGVRVSTVFLALDHQWREGGQPVLWETMIFGGPHDQYQERYTTRSGAIEGHRRACELAFAPWPVRAWRRVLARIRA